MSSPQPQKVHAWAYCPWCPEYAHSACFPITGDVFFEVDWVGREITFRVEVNNEPIEQHVQALHPDKIGRRVKHHDHAVAG